MAFAEQNSRPEQVTTHMRKNSGEIAAVIRERICLRAGTDEMLLHEGQLATEFGVSRTPIRQVLQMLAYESLVETRSGIGTIVPPLLPAAQDADETAFRAILTAAATCPLAEVRLPDVVHLRLGEARRALRDDSLAGDEKLFASLSALLEVTVALVGDHILVTALRAAYWRHIRWSLACEADARDVALARLAHLVSEAMALAEEGDLPALLSLLNNYTV